jgi:ribonuclease Y
MDTNSLLVLIVILLVSVGAGIGYLLLTIMRGRSGKAPVINDEQAAILASDKAKSLVLQAEKESLEIIGAAKEEAQKILATIKRQETDLDERERKILERSKTLDQRFDQLESKEKALEQAKADVKRARGQVNEQLEEIAKLTKEEAQDLLKKEVETELVDWTAKKIRQSELDIKREAEDKSRWILVDAMQKSATEYVAESTTTTFDIVDEALKGKIIGKEGRNIRAFERLTGVDIIVDEAPNQVTISCFDPIRREVAALSLKKLLKDGRVHPSSIEETVKKIKSELLKELRRTGDKMAYDSGFTDLPEEIIKLLGRFKYRFSYGQNLAKHTLEMVNIGAYIATTVGADIKLTKLACLLHDIGKVLTHEYEGKPHHHISGDIVRKYLKDEVLANAVESHHGDIEPKTIEAIIVQIADAISGGRPGARRDSYEDYIKRVTALESIAKQYPSVHEAFAVQAGREVRVIVQPDKASDEDTVVLAHKIAKEIEETQSYPGTVKVTVIRELRVEEEAK